MMEKEKRIGFEIKTLANLIGREIGRSGSGKYVADATGTNGFVIGYLADHAGEEVFGRDLEEYFSVRRSTMSNIILRMEQKGFLTRTPVAYDARLKKLTLTEKGMQIDAIMKDAIGDAEEKLCRGFSGEEMALLFSFLERMRRNLDDE